MVTDGLLWVLCAMGISMLGLAFYEIIKPSWPRLVRIACGVGRLLWIPAAPVAIEFIGWLWHFPFPHIFDNTDLPTRLLAAYPVMAMATAGGIALIYILFRWVPGFLASQFRRGYHSGIADRLAAPRTAPEAPQANPLPPPEPPRPYDTTGIWMPAQREWMAQYMNTPPTTPPEPIPLSDLVADMNFGDSGRVHHWLTRPAKPSPEAIEMGYLTRTIGQRANP